MLRFIASLFGCAHSRCTFPITATKRCHYRSEGKSATTYVVCLECGKEFPYDWEQMKVVGSAKGIHHAIA
jgi:RNase P subunit RPR2